MCSGVRKSGWPIPRLMMSCPCAASALAQASTAKAFSSPMRSKAAIVFGMGPGSCEAVKTACSSPDRRRKIKPDQRYRLSCGGSVGAAEPAADIAPDLRADERVRIVAHIHAAVVVERAGGKFVGAPISGRLLARDVHGVRFL